MAYRIKMCSINLNGLNFDKVHYQNQTLLSKKVDVAFLQETNIDTSHFLRSFEEIVCEYHVITERTESKSKGVSILISKNSGIKITKFECFENRIACCDCVVNGVEINLVNIYAPNAIQEQLEFIERLNSVIHNKKRIITGGDFNFVECELIDRKNKRVSKISKQKRNVK